MAQARLQQAAFNSIWTCRLAWGCAVVLALFFLLAGGWKLTDPFGAAARLAQAKVPGSLSLAAAFALGVAEVFGALLLLLPRLRRWGAWLTGLLLVAFMLHVGYYYDALRGEECSCFPWLKRSIGPGFFLTDGLMLAMAVLAGWRARPSGNFRAAAWILAGVLLFAGAGFGVAFARNSGTKAPDFITVDGRKTSLAMGKAFLYFYDPECSHCDQAARRMAKWAWKDTTVIAIPTRQPQFAAEFLQSTGLKAGTSLDLDLLKRTFPFTDPPFGVALENGRQRAAMVIFDQHEPEQTLRRLSFIR